MPSKSSKEDSGHLSPLGLRRLTGEARAKALAEPGPSWSEWAKGTAGKMYVGLGMLILDALVWVSLEESSLRLLTIPAVPLLVYLNYVLYSYLWARPPKDIQTKAQFHRTWIHPFLLGRWDPEYKAWTTGRAMKDATAVPPEEFV